MSSALKDLNNMQSFDVRFRKKSEDARKYQEKLRTNYENSIDAYTYDAVFVFNVGRDDEHVTVNKLVDENDSKVDPDDEDVVAAKKLKNTYKEVKITETDHFKNTTALTVEKLRNAGLNVKLWYSVQRDEIYCAVGATEERLSREADRTEFDLLLDEDRCIAEGRRVGIMLAKVTDNDDITDETEDKVPRNVWLNIYGRYDLPNDAEKAAVQNEDGEFQNKDIVNRQKLYIRYPDIELMQQLEAKLDDLPDDDVSREFIGQELSALKAEYQRRPNSLFSSTDRLKLLVSIIEADDEFGGAELSITKAVHNDGHSLMAFFPLHEQERQTVLKAKWFTWKSTFASPLESIRSYFGESIAFYFAFLQFYNRALIVPALFGIVLFALQLVHSRVDVSGLEFFAIGLALWATLFLESWKRHEADYRIRWGMTKFKQKEQTRPEFKSTRRIPSPVDGRQIDYYPWVRRFIKILFSQSVIWTLIFIVIAAVVSIMFLRTYLKDNVMSADNASTVTAIVNAVQIQILNVVYGNVARFLNSFENYRTDTEHENALIAKTFLFKFVNSYNSLFYVIFIKEHDEGCLNDDCLGELQYQLGTLFISLIVINNAMEIGVPFLMSKWEARKNRARAGSQEDGDFKEKSNAEKQYELAEYESTFDDFDELAIQYGFVTLFCVAFPLAPLLALFNNVLEVRVDSMKLCFLTRRPEPRGAYDIGTWYSILEIISFMAVIINVAIIVFKTDIIERLLDWDMSSTNRYQMFIGVEHVIVLLKVAVAYFVPDEPEAMLAHRERQEYVVNVLINGMHEKQDDSEFLENPVSVDTSNFDWSVVNDNFPVDKHDHGVVAGASIRSTSSVEVEMLDNEPRKEVEPADKEQE